MPVRTGRVSSREAERATLATVATNACGRHLDAALLLGLGEGREVLEAQRADVERRRAGDDLDVLLGAAQLERDAVAGQRADDVHEQARRQDDGALADDLAGERHAQPDLHVRRAQLDAVGAGEDLDARQGLHGAAGGGGAGDGLELGEQRLALRGNLHLVACFAIESDRYSLMRVTVIWVSMVCTSRAKVAAASRNLAVGGCAHETTQSVSPRGVTGGPAPR